MIWHARAPAPGTASPAAGRRGDPNAKPAPVAVATAKAQDFNVYLNALGTVTARATVTVRSRVDGQLLRVLFREGAVVKAGQLLAEIDPRSFEVQVAQANGQLAKDQALLANARVDLERYQDAARTGLDRQAAGRHAGVAGAPVRRRRSRATRAQVDNAQAAALVHADHRADRPAGSGCARSTPATWSTRSDTNGIVVITQVQPIDVVFSIPETNLPHVLQRLRAGEAMPVDAYDRDQVRKLATGKLLTIDNQIDTTTGTIKLKAEFANDDGVAVPEPVRQRADAARHAARRDRRAVGGDPARRAGQRSSTSSSADNTVTVRVGEARAGRRRDDGASTAGSRPASSSSSTAPTDCAKARRSRQPTVDRRRARRAPGRRGEGRAAGAGRPAAAAPRERSGRSRPRRAGAKATGEGRRHEGRRSRRRRDDRA